MEGVGRGRDRERQVVDDGCYGERERGEKEGLAE